MERITQLVDDGDEILGQFADTKAFVAAEEQPGPGVLSLSSSSITWWNELGAQGFTVNYYDLVIHAISRTTSSFPEPCIYCQVDPGYDADEEEDGELIEIRFVLADQQELETVYETICQGQELNPDPDSDEDAGGVDALMNPLAGMGSGWVMAPDFSMDGLESMDGDGGDFQFAPEAQATAARLTEMLMGGGAMVNGDGGEGGEEEEQEQGEDEGAE
eukprot:m.360314 g.360314  ORF g.360314 m.360314 type:complete len:217 (+) comp18966_c0_seq1:84-734(+)